MRLWRSVVGKLWMTILALVSFVLIILTILLLEFFENYNVGQIELGLTEQAKKISSIIEAHTHDDIGEKLVFEMIEPPVELAVAYDKEHFVFSSDDEDPAIPRELFLNDHELAAVFSKGETVKKELSLSDLQRETTRFDNYIIAGVPLNLDDGRQGAVFVYQSLDVLKHTSQKTTKLILLAAGIAIVLTTVFAFFLSTRITAPLRKMKEAAFEMSKGKFDTRIPSLSHDEIGELAIAFNQMGKRLKFNMNVLSQEKEQLSSILSSMADGVMTFSSDGSILITNPPAEWFLQQWHYESGSSENPVPPELAELLKQAVSTEQEQTGELTLQGRYYVMIVSPLYTLNQQSVRGAVTVLRDMTEERRLDKLRVDFVSNVSHELRTPIAMLQGYSEAIIDDIAESEEEKKEIAKIIYDESLRIGRLVNELLDLARMEAGHISLQNEEMHIEPFVQRIVNKFQGLARDNEVELKGVFEDENTILSIDPDKIEQVLTNLIDNAIRHTDKNGRILVGMDRQDSGVAIYVEDDGSGIPEEDLPFVFERFYKADKARTRGRAGTGLGLAIAKNIVDAHNGHISVKSKLGQGTTFTILLPRP